VPADWIGPGARSFETTIALMARSSRRVEDKPQHYADEAALGRHLRYRLCGSGPSFVCCRPKRRS